MISLEIWVRLNGYGLEQLVLVVQVTALANLPVHLLIN